MEYERERERYAAKALGEPFYYLGHPFSIPFSQNVSQWQSCKVMEEMLLLKGWPV